MTEGTARRPPRRVRAAIIGFALAAAAAAAAPAVASADFPQFRITHFGTDGDLTQQAGFQAPVYDSQTNQYLVVYEAGPSADTSHWAVYGQLLAADGTTVGSAFQISAPTTNELCQEDPPAVAYDPNANQFLVTWNEGTTTNCDDAVYVQRVGADGTLLGTPSQRISATGYHDIETTVPVFNPTANEWLVAWNAEGPGQTNQELWGQRLTAAGTETGTDDQQLTNFHANAGSTDDAIGVSWDSTDNRYLIVVRGVDPTVTAHDEIYGHLMAADGTTIGPDHFRISHVTDTNPGGNAHPPKVVYDPITDQFMVTWFSNSMFGSMAASETEVFGRLVGADGSVLGSGDTRYSHMGPDGDASYQVFGPTLSFNPNSGEYFLSWEGDDNTPPLVQNEFEIFGERIGGDGSPLAGGQFRISHDGPDGDPNFAANRPALAYNIYSCQTLVTWFSGDPNVGSASEEWDVYGNLVTTSCPPVNLARPSISGPAQQGKTLTCSQGTWSGTNLSFAYQWLRDGAAIAGATSSTYVVVDADVGHQLTCAVAASNADGHATATSAPVRAFDKTAPKCSLKIARHQSLGRVVKKGLRVAVRCNEAGKIKAQLLLSKKLAKRLHIGRVVGHRNKTLGKPGQLKMVLKIAHNAKKAFAGLQSVKLTLAITASDPAGNHSKRNHGFKLRR
jgi:hypothetical protein